MPIGILFNLSGSEYLLEFFVAIRSQRLPGGSCQGLNPRPSDPQPSALTIRPLVNNLLRNPGVSEDYNL